MILLIGRTYEPDATTGDMLIDGEQFCKTLERTRDDAEGHPCISEGTFRVSWAHSPRLNRECIHVDVLGRVGILVHSGSVVPNSLGCPMVGARLTHGERWELHGGINEGVLKKLEGKVHDALQAGQEVWLTTVEVTA